MGWGGRRSRGRRRPGSSPRHSRAPGEEHFISLLGKIHAFCMVDLNKKGALHTRIPRLRDRSGARKTDKSREAEYKRGVDQRLLETRSQISRKRAGAEGVRGGQPHCSGRGLGADPPPQVCPTVREGARRATIHNVSAKICGGPAKGARGLRRVSASRD